MPRASRAWKSPSRIELLQAQRLRIFSVAPGQLFESFTLCLCERAHVVVHALDLDAAVFVVQRCDHFRERLDRIVNGAPVRAPMEVALRSGHFHFHVGKPAQRIGDRGHALRKHAGVRNKDDIGFEEFFVCGDKRAQVLASDLLLAFEN